MNAENRSGLSVEQIKEIRKELKEHPFWADRREILSPLDLSQIRAVVVGDEMKRVFTGEVIFELLRDKFKALSGDYARNKQDPGYIRQAADYRASLDFLNEPGALTRPHNGDLPPLVMVRKRRQNAGH